MIHELPLNKIYFKITVWLINAHQQLVLPLSWPITNLTTLPLYYCALP